jgi:hypothetical protein
MAKKKLKRKKYEGMEMTAIKGIGIRNNTKTYINGSSATRK